MATYVTIHKEYFLPSQLAKCLCVRVAKWMRVNKYRPKIQKLEEEKEKNERAMLEAEGKEIPDRLKNKQEIQDWIEERAKRNAEISNRSDSIGSRLKF